MAQTPEQKAEAARRALLSMHAQTREGQKQPGEQPLPREQAQPPREISSAAVPIRTFVKELATPPTTRETQEPRIARAVVVPVMDMFLSTPGFARTARAGDSELQRARELIG